jgi:hypothetical protein
MNVQDILKQFKTIQPDAAFTEKSKRAILAQTPREPISARRFIFGLLETGIAVALAGFFILVVTGQFPKNSYIAPVQLSVVNPETLHAEAQAVDIQIQLANLTYQESSSTSDESTPQVAAAIVAEQPSLIAAIASSSATSSSQTASASSTASTTVSIDQALEQLSK